MIAAMSTGAATFAPSIQPLPNAEASGLLSEALETQRQSEQLFRAVFDTLPVGLWIADREGNSTLHHAQEQLRKAVRDREDILAVVTHDLRSPLSAIRILAATVELKARALADGEAVRTLARILIDVAGQMSGLVNDLLAVAVMQADDSLLNIAPADSSALLESAARMAAPLFSSQRIRLEVQVVGDLPVIQVDAERILRVLANLLDNASKFTTAGGSVLLQARAQSAGGRFSLANTGAELSAKDMESMFRPFWQAGCGDARGAGLGLSICCRSIVEAHGGRIWAESVPGKSVRICFYLPSVCHAAAAPPATCAIT